jgi:hypothetical protein
MFKNLRHTNLFVLDINLLKMKNKIILTIALAAVGLFSACSGDQTAKNTKDTVQNTYGASDTANGKGDTSKVKSSDASATGGTQALKDTGKMKDTAKKK